MNINKTLQNKAVGCYVGLAGALCALITLFVYIAMGSMYFSGLVVAGLVVGIIVFIASELINIDLGIVLSYICYLFAMYHFLVLEVEYRMDTLVDPALGFFALDGIFFVAVIFFLLTTIITIVASCMKQSKAE